MLQPKIILSHETFNSIGSWAITPILASSTDMILSSRGLNGEKKSNSPRANMTSTASTATAAAATSSAQPSQPSQTKWLILCEDQSIVDLKALINNLKNEDYTKVSAIP